MLNFITYEIISFYNLLNFIYISTIITIIMLEKVTYKLKVWGNDDGRI